MQRTVFFITLLSSTLVLLPMPQGQGQSNSPMPPYGLGPRKHAMRDLTASISPAQLAALRAKHYAARQNALNQANQTNNAASN